MAHEGCGHNFLRGLGYYDTRPLKGYFLCFSWLNYKMSPSWPKSAPNEDGVSADSRSLSTLRLCLAAAGDSSSDPQNRGPQWGGHMLAVLLHPLLSHAWGNLKKHWLPQFYSVQHRTQAPSKRCLEVASNGPRPLQQRAVAHTFSALPGASTSPALLTGCLGPTISHSNPSVQAGNVMAILMTRCISLLAFRASRDGRQQAAGRREEAQRMEKETSPSLAAYQKEKIISAMFVCNPPSLSHNIRKY